MIEKNFVTKSEDETEQIGRLLAKNLKGNEVIALCGDLGAGKTALVRGAAKELHVDSDVSSPTFALVHEYECESFPVYHFDMYRILSYEDLYSTGYFDYIDTGVLFIEWSENITEFLPDNKIEVTIKKCNEATRDIKIKTKGEFTLENTWN